jgi:hypothetical protein
MNDATNDAAIEHTVSNFLSRSMAGEYNKPLRSFRSRHKVWHCVLGISYHASMPSVLLCFVQEVAQTIV